MNAGDTFLIPDGISAHLSFVIAVLGDGSLVICHFTGRGPRSDPTCIVHIGEHPFITKETAIRFDQAYICTPDRLENLTRVITRQLECLSAGLLARIRQGALESPQTPDAIKERLRNG